MKNKRILILLPMVMLLLALSISSALAATYDIKLGSVQVNDDNKGNILGDGKARYDSETNTLYLDNPTLTGLANTALGVVFDTTNAKEGLTIVGSLTLEREARVSGTALYRMVSLGYNTTLQGTFNFNAKGEKVVALHYSGPLNILPGTTLNVSAEAKNEAAMTSYKGRINMTGGTVTVNNLDGDAVLFFNDGSINIENGKFTAKGGKAGICVNESNVPAFSPTVSIKGAEVNAEGSEYGVVVNSQSNNGGSLSILNGAQVSASATADTGIAIRVENTITIDGAKVSAVGGQAGLDAKSIAIQNVIGTDAVKAVGTGTGSYGIRSTQNTKILNVGLNSVYAKGQQYGYGSSDSGRMEVDLNGASGYGTYVTLEGSTNACQKWYLTRRSNAAMKPEVVNPDNFPFTPNYGNGFFLNGAALTHVEIGFKAPKYSYSIFPPSVTWKKGLSTPDYAYQVSPVSVNGISDQNIATSIKEIWIQNKASGPNQLVWTPNQTDKVNVETFYNGLEISPYYEELTEGEYTLTVVMQAEGYQKTDLTADLIVEEYDLQVEPNPAQWHRGITEGPLMFTISDKNGHPMTSLDFDTDSWDMDGVVNRQMLDAPLWAYPNVSPYEINFGIQTEYMDKLTPGNHVLTIRGTSQGTPYPVNITVIVDRVTVTKKVQSGTAVTTPQGESFTFDVYAYPKLNAGIEVIWPDDTNFFFDAQALDEYINGQGEEAQKALASGDFIVDDDGKLVKWVGEYTTDADGKLEFEQHYFPRGEKYAYFIQEKDAEGYRRASYKLNNGAAQIEIVNEKISDTVINKVDEEGKKISNVNFKLFGYPVMYPIREAKLLKKVVIDYSSYCGACGDDDIEVKYENADFYFTVTFENGTKKQVSFDEMTAGFDFRISKGQEKIRVEEHLEYELTQVPFGNTHRETFDIVMDLILNQNDDGSVDSVIVTRSITFTDPMGNQNYRAQFWPTMEQHFGPDEDIAIDLTNRLPIRVWPSGI